MWECCAQSIMTIIGGPFAPLCKSDPLTGCAPSQVYLADTLTRAHGRGGVRREASRDSIRW